jgi:hypothetical protein
VRLRATTISRIEVGAQKREHPTGSPFFFCIELAAQSALNARKVAGAVAFLASVLGGKRGLADRCQRWRRDQTCGVAGARRQHLGGPRRHPIRAFRVNDPETRPACSG